MLGPPALQDGTARDLDHVAPVMILSLAPEAASRLARQRAFLRGDGEGSLHALYFGADRESEPFALLHRSHG